MKKINYFIVIIFLPAIIIVLLFLNFVVGPYIVKTTYKDFKIISYSLNGKRLNLLVADTPQKWEKGLMYYKKLQGVDGIIFLFPDKQYRTFWNKNTLMDMDLYWLDNDSVVGKDFLPSIDISKKIVVVNSPKAVNKVIELEKKKVNYFLRASIPGSVPFSMNSSIAPPPVEM